MFFVSKLFFDTNLLELLPKVLVQPGVQKRIVAGAAHGQAVSYEEEYLIVLQVRNWGIKVLDHVNDVQG